MSTLLLGVGSRYKLKPNPRPMPPLPPCCRRCRPPRHRKSEDRAAFLACALHSFRAPLCETCVQLFAVCGLCLQFQSSRRGYKQVDASYGTPRSLSLDRPLVLPRNKRRSIDHLDFMIRPPKKLNSMYMFWKTNKDWINTIAV